MDESIVSLMGPVLGVGFSCVACVAFGCIVRQCRKQIPQQPTQIQQIPTQIQQIPIQYYPTTLQPAQPSPQHLVYPYPYPYPPIRHIPAPSAPADQSQIFVYTD